MITMIAATESNNGIGFKGQMPWHVSSELKFFRETTKNHALIMGRKTWGGFAKPLPMRTHIVLTTDKTPIDSAYAVQTVEQAVKLAKEFDELLYQTGEIFVIGGGKVYQSFLDIADKIVLSRLKLSMTCDTFFPEFENFVLQGVENFEHFDVETWIR